MRELRKSLKFQIFHMRITKIMEILNIPNEIHTNQENLVISCDNIENHNNHRNPREN